MSSGDSKHDIDLALSVIGEKSAVLRSWKESDLSQVIRLEQGASRFPWSEKNLRDSFASSHICVGVFIESRCIAQAVFSLAAGEAELLILTVAEEYRRKGLASELLLGMETKLSESVSQIFLEVRESNIAAINLYESLGFNCLGERRDYYPPVRNQKSRENALIYAKHIASDIGN